MPQTELRPLTEAGEEFLAELEAEEREREAHAARAHRRKQHQRRRTVSAPSTEKEKKQRNQPAKHVSFDLLANTGVTYTPPRRKRRFPLQHVRQRFEGSGFDFETFFKTGANSPETCILPEDAELPKGRPKRKARLTPPPPAGSVDSTTSSDDSSSSDSVPAAEQDEQVDAVDTAATDVTTAAAATDDVAAAAEAAAAAVSSEEASPCTEKEANPCTDETDDSSSAANSSETDSGTDDGAPLSKSAKKRRRRKRREAEKAAEAAAHTDETKKPSPTFRENAKGAPPPSLPKIPEVVSAEVREEVGVLPPSTPGPSCGEPEKRSGELPPLACRHDFFQTSTAVSVSLFVKEQPKELVSFAFEQGEAVVRGPDWIWRLDPYGAVDPDKSKLRVGRVKIEVVLAKTDPTQWPTLAKSAANGQNSAMSAATQPMPTLATAPAAAPAPSPIVNGSGRAEIPEPTYHGQNTDEGEIELCLPKFADFGRCGLENLGNTCYMNSVLQCLFQLRALRDLMLPSLEHLDINTDNPLGSGGVFVKTFAQLMQRIWSKSVQSVRPQALRRVVGTIKPDFAGPTQHDAHEMLQLAVDTLHEDLNRVRKKPYIELPDTTDKPDAEAASIAWKNHHARNDSPIGDLFHGLYRSRLTCTECGFVSIRFDPFDSVSLPLPRKLRTLTIKFLPLHGVPRAITVEVPESDTVLNLLVTLGKVVGLPPMRLRCCEIYQGKLFKEYREKDPIQEIAENDQIYAYELPEKRGEAMWVLQLLSQRCEAESCAKCKAKPEASVFRCTRCKSVCYCSVACQREHWTSHKPKCKAPVPKPFVFPIILAKASLSKSYDELRAALMAHAKEHLDICQDAGAPSVSVKRCSRFGAIEGNGSLNIVNGELSLANVDHLALCWDCGEGVVQAKQGEKVEQHASKIVKDFENHATLKNAFHLFEEDEALGGDDAWRCPKCQDFREVSKKMTLWSAPEILVLHLKRFSWKNILWRQKLDFAIDFPLDDLDIGEFLPAEHEASSKYRLVGVVNHYGRIWGGHYTAFARHADTGDWLHCDDESCRAASEESVKTRNAYILVYERKSVSADV
eukprot:m.70605 g.70605  ORF g.70605 m.70605 type:complete len:1076 (+) comp7888_c0_seq2:101-3328(+)